MKKTLLTMMCLAAMMMAGTSLKVQEVTIALLPGWTWISYPRADTLEVATALGSFTPMEGDMIKTQYGFSNYHEGNWNGSVQYFYPGMGYMYYSTRVVPTIIVFGASTPQAPVVVTTLEPTDITTNSATSGGSIATDAYVFAKGICWATHPDPTQSNDYYSENGSGDESFTAEMTGLSQNTTYYVRAYAVTQDGIAYGNEVSFTTIVEYEYVDLGLPSGLLWAACNLGADVPEDYGDYFAWGETQPKDNFSWTNYQYCMGSFNTLTKYCNNSDIGYNGFTDDLTTLEPSDDAATVNWGDDWRMPTDGEWQELYQNTTVTWTTQNGVNGRLFTASNGNSLFLPAAGYCNESIPEAAGIIGDYWTSSLDTDYPSGALSFFFNSSNYYISFCNRLYGRNVRAVRSGSQSTSFIIDATANPVEGGVVSGGGSYQVGAECTLTATANEGYTFTNWTENDSVVSTNANYTFTVNANRTLVANFTYAPSWFNGVLPGVFSVSATRQVNFSQGNLQYQASSNTWKFANDQYDYVGSTNSNISSTYNGWIDLFGWGTSGYHYNSDMYNTNYYPYSTSASLVNRTFNYFGYGPSINMPSNNLNGTSASYDWGVYNPINNGGNTANNWRILTQSEWNYLFNTRNTISGIRYAQARVNGINGILLLPDNWSSDIYSLNNANGNGSSFDNNVISDTDWIVLENAGVVFLPASGNRYETSVSGVGSLGSYWSASCCTNNCVSASSLQFGNSYANTNYDNDRCRGLSVRLVRNAE